MQPRTKHLLGACFFVGGATSLVLEVAWAKELSYSLGNTLHAVSTSIAAFMAGLAFGSHLASRRLGTVRHPVLLYAGLQLGIGACGALSIPVLRSTPPLLVALHDAFGDWTGAFLAARFALVFVLMLVPVTLMGMTLPLMAGIYGRAKERYDFEIGVLYGLNTLGAVIGCLLAGFALIPSLGLLRTCLAVGAADVAVGLVALALLPALRGAVPPPAPPGPPGRGPEAGARRSGAGAARSLVALLYLVSGTVAIVLEVGWFRFLAYVFGPTANAFSVMLAMFLAGIGLGSVAGARIARSARDPIAVVAGMELALAFVVLLGSALFNRLPGAYGALFLRLPDGSVASALAAQSAIAAVVVLPATLLMGALFPVVVRAYAERGPSGRDPERTVGRLYAANTVGGILGSLLAGFWLLPRVGIFDTQLAAGCASLGVGAVFLALATARPARSRARAVLVSGLAFAVLVAAVPRLDFLALNKGSYLALANERGFDAMQGVGYDRGRRLLFYREGINNSVAVTANDGNSGNLFLRVSGKPVADTRLTGRVHLVLLGQIPYLLARDPRRAAVIGFGTGATTGSSLTHPRVESLDLAELEASVLEAAQFFRYRNHDALADPRLHATIEDGRTFLLYTDRRFDVITTDPISPVVAGAANLYTVDFYALAASRLAEGGVFCQWLETWIPSEHTLRGIMASALAAFPHVALFLIGEDYALVGSNDPIRIPWPEFVARMRPEAVREDLERIHVESPEQLMSFFLAGTRTVRAYAGDATPNTDDANWLERRMPYELNRRRREDALSRGVAALGGRLASLRLQDLRSLAPGLPLAEIVRATAAPWPPTFPNGARRILLQGFAAAFRAEGATQEAALARSLLAHWERPAQQPPSEAAYRALVSALEAARATDRPDEEERLLREILRNPTGRHQYAAGLELTRLLAETGRPEEAMGVARFLQEEFAARPAAFALEAGILRDLGREEDARRAAERGLTFAPDAETLRALRDG